MPIFEYVCGACDHTFETIVRGHEPPACPACHSRDLRKQLSVFAVGANDSGAGAASAGPCGRCGDPRGPGACSLN